MADKSGQAEIRGLDIDKMVKGFADEEFIMKSFVTLAKTTSREIRWYQKVAGVLTGPTTTGITASQIANTSSKSLPVVEEPSYNRKQSFVRKYFVESPWITDEDIQDSDVDLIGNIARDLTRAVAFQVDTRITNILQDNVSGTPFDGTDVPSAATAAPWDDPTSTDPVGDLTSAKKSIASFNYEPEGAICLMNEAEHKLLVDWIINTKGSSIPGYSTERAKDGVVMGFVGLRVRVNSFVPTDSVTVFVPQRACTYKQFKPITAETLRDPGIGRKIRVWEQGEAILTDPNAVYGITNTVS